MQCTNSEALELAQRRQIATEQRHLGLVRMVKGMLMALSRVG